MSVSVSVWVFVRVSGGVQLKRKERREGQSSRKQLVGLVLWALKKIKCGGMGRGWRGEYEWTEDTPEEMTGGSSMLTIRRRTEEVTCIKMMSTVASVAARSNRPTVRTQVS